MMHYRRTLQLAATFLLCLWIDGPAQSEPRRIALIKPDGEIARQAPLSGIASSTIYRANRETGFYNHHPHLTRLDGAFFVSWSNHPVDEDERGQRVLFSRSVNGQEWSAATVLFPSLKGADGQQLVLTANGWLTFQGRLYAIADLHDNIGWSNNEGRIIAKQQSPRAYRTAQRSLGRLARRVDKNGGLDLPFWLARLEAGGVSCAACRAQPAIAAALNAMLLEPLNRRHWQLMDGNRLGYWVDRYPVRGNDGHYLVEPTTYRARDGSWVRLLRDLDASFRIYATTSRNGTTWDTPSRSDIPDSPSLSCAGTLPDGRRYLINNPVPNSRDPLVLRLSQDGLSFGPAQVLRRGAPALRHAGLHKGPGFQYPSAGLAENALWVVYSVNKEDIEISRIPLQDLNGAGRRR